MVITVNAGARLDRLPISSFHYRIFWLVGAGMFFDGYDLYVAGGVLASPLQTKFSTLPQNLHFISLTFVGMTLGALITGFVGDRYGRRFTYQINLLIFGLASLAAAFAQDMTQLIVCRFVQGLASAPRSWSAIRRMTEFVPPKTRGRWLSMMAFLVVAGFPATALLGYLIIPAFGWRPMFVIAGIGSLIVWYLRKNLPESPRWLEAQGRTDEAEALMQIDRAGSVRRQGVAAGACCRPRCRGRACRRCQAAAGAAPVRRLLGADHHQHADLRLRAVPAAVLPAPGPDHHQLAGLYAGALGRLAGRLRARRLPVRRHRTALEHHRRVRRHHRHRLIYARFNAGDDPTIVLCVGFVLIVAIYIQTALLFGVYTPELFPTEIRLRANGICNTLGRGATVVSPFIVGALIASYQLPGVIWLMIGLVVIQIVVVWLWGVEPRNRGLEDVAGAA